MAHACGLRHATLMLCAIAASVAQGESTVFTAACGARGAVIPVLYDYPGGLARDLGIRVTCRYDREALSFTVAVPKDEDYTPAASSQPDGPQWMEDGVELFLQPPGGALRQFIVNTAGVVWDANDGDVAWNSGLRVKASLLPASWALDLVLPLADLGLPVAAGGEAFQFNLVVRTRSGGEALTATAVPTTPPRFAAPGNFGALRLGRAGEVTVQDLELQWHLLDGRPALRQVVRKSDGATRSQDTPANGERVPVTVGAGDGFGLSLVLSNPYAPAVSVKREGPDGLVLVLEHPDAVGQVGDALALSLDGRRLAPVPVQARVKLPLRASALRPGKHVLVADLLRSQKAVASGRCEFTSFDESPLPFDLADADVSAYYAPVLDAFPSVRAAKTLFRLGRNGLPDSLKVDGCELLAGGVRLVSGGRPAACTVRKTRAHRNGVTFDGRSPDIGLQGSIEFDGLAWYEVSLALPRPTSRAYLEVPLRFPEGSPLFLSHGNWSKALPEGRTWSALTQGVQVTDGQRGLSVYLPPKAADLNLESYDRILEVRRRGWLVTLRLHLSDGRLALSPQRVNFAFGLQPFPFRDYPDDANFRYRIVRAHGYDYRKSVRPELLAAYQASGTRYMIHHEWWNPLQSYYTLLSGQDQFRELVRDTHASGIGYVPYFGFQISEKAPEFTLYYPHVGPGGTEQPYIAPNTTPAKSYSVCYGSIWGDHWLRGLARFVRDHPVDGIYMDGTLCPGACTNASHGHELRDSRGRVVPYFTTREMRRFALLLHAATRGQRPGMLWDLHNSGQLLGVSMSLVDVEWTGEQVWCYDPQWKVPLDVYRAQFNGRLYGIPIQYLTNRAHEFYRRDWGVTLLFDALLRPMEGLGVWQQDTFRLWRLFDEYELRGEYFTPFYAVGARYRDASGQALVSYYETPRQVVLVVSNYQGSSPVNASLDFAQTPLATATLAHDIWTGEELPIHDGVLSVPVPAEGHRMLSVRPR